jgi:hypothetical protein
MKKEEKSILIGVGAVLAGFGVYRYFDKKRQSKKAETAATDSTNATNNPNNTTAYPGPYTGPNTYQQKVMDIQSILGVAIDGDPGAQTNGALSKKVPLTFAKYGVITQANVTFYLTLLKGPSFLWL